MKKQRLFMLFSVLLLLSGCTSFGRGVAEAFLDKEEEVDKAVRNLQAYDYSALQRLLRDHNVSWQYQFLSQEVAVHCQVR